MSRTTNINVRLTEAEKAALTELAYQRRQSVSAVVQQAIARLIAAEAPQQSCPVDEVEL